VEGWKRRRGLGLGRGAGMEGVGWKVLWVERGKKGEAVAGFISGVEEGGCE
jgi:hypothetical protein